MTRYVNRYDRLPAWARQQSARLARVGSADADRELDRLEGAAQDGDLGDVAPDDERQAREADALRWRMALVADDEEER